MSGVVPPLPALTKYFESAEQTITAGGPLTIAHGLGVKPKLVLPFLVCKTAEDGYSVGDIVPVNMADNTSGGGTNSGQSIEADATNILIRFGTTAASYSYMNKSTGAGADITNGNWKFIARAWA